MRASRLLLLAVMCVFSACRTSKADPVELANQRVEQAISKGTTRSSEAGPAALKVRYNPAACDCPPYEVFAYGRWMRAFVDGDSPAVSALQNADSLATATLVGVVDAARAADNGVWYPVVKIR